MPPETNKLSFFFIILILLGLMAMKDGQEKDLSINLKVLSANLHVAAGVDPLDGKGLSREEVLKNLQKAYEIFKRNDADIILLQEVDFNSKRTANIDQGKWLAERLGMFLTYAETFNTHGVDYPYPEVLKDCLYGIAILSKEKPGDVVKVWLENPPEVRDWPENERRVLLGVELSHNDKKVWVYNTHLDYRSRIIRKIEMQQISGKISGKTAVIGGDFNEPWPLFEPVTDEDRKLVKLHGWKEEKGWQTEWPLILEVKSGLEQKNPPTYPAGEKVKIDHIFTSSKVKIKSMKTIDSEGVSDHFFVLAEIVFN